MAGRNAVEQQKFLYVTPTAKNRIISPLDNLNLKDNRKEEKNES